MKRFNVLVFFLLIAILIILVKSFYITIINNHKYKNIMDNVIYSTIEGSNPKRGRIYDRNHKLLVDNNSIINIYYKRENGVSNKEEIEIAKDISNLIDLNYEFVTDSMLKDVWLVLNDGYKKVKDGEKKLLKVRRISNEKINSIIRERITKEELSKIDKKTAYVYYLMHNDYYYKDKLIKKNINEEEYNIINSGKYKGFKCKESWERKYIYGNTLRGILGSVSNENIGITNDLKDYYLKKGYKLTDRVGLSGIELQYDEYLRGKPARYKNYGNGLELINKEKNGNDLILSIDINLQLEFESIVEKEIVRAKKEPNTEYFNKVFVIVSNPSNGEILSMIGKYIANNKIYDYSSYIPISSVTVGSVIKGASISVGYKTKVIDIGTIFKDECIKISNTSLKCSWNRNGLGYLDDINALRLSSNVYQFKTAMKVADYNYCYNCPFSFNNDPFTIYRNMFNSYGLGVKTGIDLPYESIGIIGKNDTPGLLLDFSIGQYDTYTPLQLTQYINTIANNGTRIKLNLLKSVYKDDDLLLNNKTYILNKVELDDKYFKRIKEGFKAVLGYNGTGYGYIDLKYNPAGKTGTSQSFLDSDNDGVIDKQTITSTFAGFAPLDDPQMSIVVITPDISHIYGSSYMSTINRRISNQITKKYFEIYK